MTNQKKEAKMGKLLYAIISAETKLYDLRAQYAKLSWLPDEPEPTQAPELQLTVEQWQVLHRAKNDNLITGDSFYFSFKNEICDLRDTGYIIEPKQDSLLVSWHITDTGRAALKAHEETQSTAPRCSCGKTENLTEVRATPESTYHLCQRCKAEERQL